VSDAPALTLEHIAKRFGETHALRDASLSVRRGTIHAVLGENGAGKTTLMRIAFGLVHPDAGSIVINGQPLLPRSPLDAIARGVGMVHQHFTIVPAMTVAENVALGGSGRIDQRAAAEAVERIGRESGLVLDPAARAGDLAVSAQQRLEIVKALARGAKILILDEPTAVLAPAETDDLLRVLRRFTDAGGSAVLITHKLRDALGAADAITVLRDGRTVWTGTPGETDERSLARATVGDLPDRPARRNATPGDVMLRATGLRVRDARGTERVRGVTVEVRRGEVLGIVGVEGAGQHELLRALAGRVHPASGSIERPASVAFIPEDRQRDALVLTFSLSENVALRGAGSARGTIAWRAIAARTAGLLERFGVRPPRPEALAGGLSGGNQQRLVLARELGDDPPAVVAENPTRGLDVAATATTHRSLLAMRDAGAAVVLYSSDLDEVLELADRVIVMHAGAAHTVAADRATIALAMLGGAA
jgi:simple sugar transport system ATP-binding protein